MKNDNAEEMLYYPCDILIPAAVEFMINDDNHKKIAASMIVEIAGNSLTFAAQKKLYERGVPIIPDLLSNSGSGMLSYIEWLKGKSHNNTNIVKILSGIKNIDSSLYSEVSKNMPIGEKEAVIMGLGFWVSRIADDVLNYSQIENVSLKTAAYCLAIQRINEYIDKMKQEKTL